jgi:hypothetical protein
MILNFERIDQRWYLKDERWKGDKEALQMVAGADYLLEAIKHKANSVKLRVLTENTITQEDLDGSLLYTHAKALDNRGTYIVPLVGWKFWLCSVTEWVFGYMPTDLYFRVVE